MYNPEEKLPRLGSFHFSFVFYSVSPVSWPACLPVLVSSQSDGIQHRTLFGPPAAYRRIREEESPGHRIWGFPETPKWTTQIMCTYPFSSFLPSRVAVDIVKAALYRSEFDYCLFVFLGLVWREASRAPSDPEATESGSAVRRGPELASSTWEAHLWILRLWSQCTFRSFPFLHDGILSQLTNQHVSCSLPVSWFHAYQGSTRHRVHPGCLRKNEGMCSDLMWLFNYLHFFF